MRSLRPVVVLLLAAASGLTSSATAQAAIPWSACKPAGFQCSKVAVQLDRSGAVAGSITLDVTRRPATNTPAAKTAVIALAGGPGQAAVPFASSFASDFAPALADRDLLVFNQRGTGRSGPIACSALRRSSGSVRRVVQDCSQQLGAKRGFYATAQSVADIESLRVAGGYDKLLLTGVSYGTKVALAYAAAYPANVESLVLDSVVTPEGPDALRRSSLAAVPRAIGSDLCGAGDCASSTPNAVADLQQLVARLDRSSIKGGVFSGSGRRYTARLGTNGLASILIAGDINPTLRAELPGAVKAALTGDRQPILRLSARAAGLDNASGLSAPTPTRLQSEASSSLAEITLYYATICEEAAFPWTRGAPVAQRAREAAAAIGALPAGTFGIFGTSPSVALGGLVDLCLGWSVASPPAPAAGPLPDVPVLILEGQGDLRTPLEDAQAVAARFPRAQLVAVPHTGHSVLSAESGSCGKDALRAFLTSAPIAACAAAANDFAPTPTPPRTLGAFSAIGGVPAKVGRTFSAFTATLTDGRRQIIGDAIALGDLPTSVGGLRSGSIRVRSSSRLEFRAYEFVPGVTVTGTRRSGTSTFRISGSKAARGTITLLANGTAKGRLGGRSFRLRPAAAGASVRGGELPSIDEALAIGRSRVGG